MSKSIFNEMLDREVQRAKQKPSVEDAIARITGKDNRIVPKSKPKYTEAQKAERMAKVKAIRDSKAIDHIKQIPEIEHIAKIPEIPTGFPKGTVLNDDGTLTLPDGRTLRRKKQGVSHG